MEFKKLFQKKAGKDNERNKKRDKEKINHKMADQNLTMLIITFKW